MFSSINSFKQIQRTLEVWEHITMMLETVLRTDIPLYQGLGGSE